MRVQIDSAAASLLKECEVVGRTKDERKGKAFSKSLSSFLVHALVPQIIQEKAR